MTSNTRFEVLKRFYLIRGTSLNLMHRYIMYQHKSTKIGSISDSDKDVIFGYRLYKGMIYASMNNYDILAR